MGRRAFAAEFKREAVKAALQPGVSKAQLVEDLGLHPNTLNRGLEAAGPSKKRAADFTYLWTAEGWLFPAVVLDL